MVFRSIAERSEIDFLVSCSGKRAASAQWVSGLLERGEARLQWCRLAVSERGDLLAAHVLDSWSPDGPPGGAPTFVQLLGHSDEAAAVALLENDVCEFAAQSIDARLVVDSDSSPELRALREEQQRVLTTAGFGVAVDRVRLEWLGSPLPSQAVRLTFRSAAEMTEDELIEIFAAVGDGSVDHGMATGRVEAGRREEAATRLGRAQRRPLEHDCFVIGVNRAGEPIGYVQSAIIDGRAVLAEVGVVESQRGHGYVDELLAYGTGVLVDRGQSRIRAFTDVENRAMRKAFARCGYTETGSRRDFRRSVTASTST